ncbi:hypothetical protein J416_11387 [Gracilibacillus halophilus YIM-C55.5]|uniref:Uncharacterized protein n=1 Tax=Gracilibacillus halophilus YIM-C55.5 TaxID=1308866 RepID=N4WJI6_9BACI|nr:hypothetical protein [Gracilibacillus halophilus]ENH96327.1 hypothetical protein J416_11387 [Gracilibacillus halophilus YIM-C55.5]
MKHNFDHLSKSSTLNQIEFSQESREKVMEKVAKYEKKSWFQTIGMKWLSATALLLLCMIPIYIIMTSLKDSGETIPSPETPPVEKLENQYYQLTIDKEYDENLRLINYDTEDELIKAYTKFTSQELAEETVNNQFRVESDGVYALEVDGPPRLDTNEEYQTNQMSETKYQVRQEPNGELYGADPIVVEYRYVEDHWIIEDRWVDVQDAPTN